MFSLLSALVLAQFEIVTPGQSDTIGPPGLLDPEPVAAADAGPSDAGASPATDAGAVQQDWLGDAGLATTVADAGPPDGGEAPKPANALSGGWGGSANLSLIAFTGNTESLLVSANLTLTKIFRDGWIGTLHAVGNYGEARPSPGLPVAVNALSAGGQLRGDRVFARSATVYLLGGVDSDHIDSLELREYGEPGVALFWLDRRQGDVERLLLRTDFGLRYAHETRFQYYPTEMNLGVVQFAGPRVGVAFHVAASKEVAFAQEGELLRDLTSSRLMVNTSTKLLAHLVKQFALTVTFLVAYDSAPPLNRLTTDTSLSAGIEMKF